MIFVSCENSFLLEEQNLKYKWSIAFFSMIINMTSRVCV